MQAASGAPFTGWPLVSTKPLWWGFVPYIVISLIHVAILAFGTADAAQPSKLLLMPALALALLWGVFGSTYRTGFVVLLAAVLLSWLGDGAGSFFPSAPTLPLMLAFFGLAHLYYMGAFWRHFILRPLSRWALVYVIWWIVLLLAIAPQAGGLAVAVAVYGVVLGGTAVLASRCHRLILIGGVFFLASDSILAFRLFAADLMPGWTSPLVMVTYTLGQGLIIAGALVTLHSRATPRGHADKVVP